MGWVPKCPPMVTSIVLGCLCWKFLPKFEDGQSLHTFVGNSVPNNLLQILDPNLVLRNRT